MRMAQHRRAHFSPAATSDATNLRLFRPFFADFARSRAKSRQKRPVFRVCMLPDNRLHTRDGLAISQRQTARLLGRFFRPLLPGCSFFAGDLFGRVDDLHFRDIQHILQNKRLRELSTKE